RHYRTPRTGVPSSAIIVEVNKHRPRRSIRGRRGGESAARREGSARGTRGRDGYRPDGREPLPPEGEEELPAGWLVPEAFEPEPPDDLLSWQPASRASVSPVAAKAAKVMERVGRVPTRCVFMRMGLLVQRE